MIWQEAEDMYIPGPVLEGNDIAICRVMCVCTQIFVGNMTVLLDIHNDPQGPANEAVNLLCWGLQQGPPFLLH